MKATALFLIINLPLFIHFAPAQDSAPVDSKARNMIGINFAGLLTRHDEVPHQIIYKRSYPRGNIRAGINFLQHKNQNSSRYILLHDSTYIKESNYDFKQQSSAFIGYEITIKINKLSWKIGADLSVGSHDQSKRIHTSQAILRTDSLFSFFTQTHTVGLHYEERHGLQIGFSPFIGVNYDISPRWDFSASFVSFLYFMDSHYEFHLDNTQIRKTRFSHMALIPGPPVGELALFYKFN